MRVAALPFRDLPPISTHDSRRRRLVYLLVDHGLPGVLWTASAATGLGFLGVWFKTPSRHGTQSETGLSGDHRASVSCGCFCAAPLLFLFPRTARMVTSGFSSSVGSLLMGVVVALLVGAEIGALC